VRRGFLPKCHENRPEFGLNLSQLARDCASERENAHPPIFFQFIAGRSPIDNFRTLVKDERRQQPLEGAVNKHLGQEL
jgi:hypothetical protein